MPIRTTRPRAALVALPLALPLAAAGLTAPAHAEEPAPTITRITTANEGGGLTPYIPLYTTVRVEFTDPTPSAEEAYEVTVPGVATSSVVVATGAGEFALSFPIYDLEPDQSYDIAVQELDEDGTPVAVSEPLTWTAELVGHPRKLRSNVTKVGRQWTYTAGRRAKLRFRGAVEPGTEVHTRGWVSRRKAFTSDDWSANTYKKAALVDRACAELVP